MSRRQRRRGHRAGPRRRSRPHLSGARTRPAASAFCGCLAEEFDIDHEAVKELLRPRSRRPPSRPSARRRARAARALTPPRLNLLRQFNALPEGVKFLVDLRAELIELGAAPTRRCASLADDLTRAARQLVRHRLSRIARITWEAPAALLEKLIAYEAVHEIRGWTDLKNRLEADRRCFAFFHPRMPDEPLIFVEVALVRGMAGNIHALLDEAAPIGDPQAADTAIFYSISNCQRGLAGISFGDFLIKRVVDALAAELPRLKIVRDLIAAAGVPHLARAESRRAAGLLRETARDDRRSCAGAEETGRQILLRCSTARTGTEDPRAAAALREPLLRLCAQYLQAHAAVGRGRRSGGAFPSHQRRARRAAQLARRHSPKGLQQSAGIMVNYLYPARRDRGQSRGLPRERRVVAACAAWRGPAEPARAAASNAVGPDHVLSSARGYRRRTPARSAGRYVAAAC